MGFFRFQKRIGLGKFARVNLSKSGASLSLGVPGLRTTFGGPRGTRTTFGIPGSGLSYTATTGASHRVGCFPSPVGSAVVDARPVCELPACDPRFVGVGRVVGFLFVGAVALVAVVVLGLLMLA